MLRHDATKVTLTEATVGQDRKVVLSILLRQVIPLETMRVVLSILSRQVIPLETMFPMTPTRGALSIASYEASSTARGFSLGATLKSYMQVGLSIPRTGYQNFALLS